MYNYMIPFLYTLFVFLWRQNIKERTLHDNTGIQGSGGMRDEESGNVCIYSTLEHITFSQGQ